MIFNSFVFLFLFLPIIVAGAYYLAGYRHRSPVVWLFAGSLVFYAYGGLNHVWLMLTSIICNYVAGNAIAQRCESENSKAKKLLVTSVAANLCLLAYYKYLGFFAMIARENFSLPFEVGKVVLPLGISFFTFTQITFLVDAYKNQVARIRFPEYCLFVTYFPHLVAGLILHHKEMIGQFCAPKAFTFSSRNMAAGLAMFVFGLSKKVLLADSIAPIANAVFDFHGPGSLTPFEAWIGALAYTYQIYYDFSGYCDMAVGTSLMLGIRLPANFHSPYKAGNIIEFWRRWHMTLSRLLKNYLYIPLGGNRKGLRRRHLNLMLTMLLGGLWHGADWTFIVWGGLHGLYLIVNHGFTRLVAWPGTHLARLAGWLVTFVAVVVAWVVFRAESVGAALSVLRSMADLEGFHLPTPVADVIRATTGLTLAGGGGVNDLIDCYTALPLLLLLFVTSTSLPNTQQLVRRFRPVLDVVPPAWVSMTWNPTPVWGAGVGVLFALCLSMINRESPFLYFRF